MELSNLQPAAGSKHSDNFRRGRGHGSGMVRQLEGSQRTEGSFRSTKNWFRRWTDAIIQKTS